jgi:hypothetical protein
MEFLFKLFQQYCKALADPSNDTGDTVMLVAIGILITLAACLIGVPLVVGIMASHGLLLIPMVVVYYVFKGMMFYGKLLHNDFEDD